MLLAMTVLVVARILTMPLGRLVLVAAAGQPIVPHFFSGVTNPAKNWYSTTPVFKVDY